MAQSILKKQEQIYLVTFGKEYDGANEPVFYDKVFLPNDSKRGAGVPVKLYASFERGKLLELVTKTEIPIVKSSSIPGFGAYKLNPVYTIEDYQALSYYLSLVSSDNVEFFQMAITSMIKYLNWARSKYLASHSDEYGCLSHQSEEREIAFQKRYNFCIKMVNDLCGRNNFPK